ncbi:TPA: hypothetical protein HA278_01435, partial [Candidatus Woesearchaeota archaeon]|nr:hypothetical protein [Candidatus Woesearchaeota archaeon]
DDGEGIAETQLEILQQLPDYTSIKLFVSSEDRQSYLQKTLPPGLYDRITFVKVPKGHRFSPWAQDYSEGDNSVQILPLTYLGGGSRRNPGKPENDLVYQYEGEGLEVRRVPVEFAGGNVYVTRNKAGRKILLVGGDSYLATERSYTKLGETITEERYREVMRTTFNVDEVEIIATRDAANKIQPQSRSIFHIDQMMIPLDDGVVAIPDVEVTPPTLTKEEVVEQENEEYTRLAAKYGLSKKKGTWIDTSSLSPEEKKRFREDQRKVRERHQDFRREIRFYEDSVEVKRQIDHHRSNLEQRGFDVVPLKSDSQSVGRFQAYTNGIVYKDRNTGQRTVIMPIFPNKQGEYTLEGINLENKEAYERAGYKVKTVRDKAFKQSGNIHCLTILAQAPKTCPECNLRVG